MGSALTAQALTLFTKWIQISDFLFSPLLFVTGRVEVTLTAQLLDSTEAEPRPLFPRHSGFTWSQNSASTRPKKRENAPRTRWEIATK